MRGEGWGEGDLIASSNLSKKYSCNIRARFFTTFRMTRNAGLSFWRSAATKNLGVVPRREEGNVSEPIVKGVLLA